MTNPSCWPTSDERHLLRAAVLGRHSARASFDEWSRRVALDHVEPGSQALLPLVDHNLMGEVLPPPIAGRLRGLRRHAWINNQQRAWRLAGVLSALDREQIPALIFKGLPLALLNYPSASTRVMSDVDLWVPPSGIPKARSILAAAGFVASPGLNQWPPAGQPAWAYVHVSGECIDLHAHVLADALYDAADATILRRAVSTSVCGAPVLVPDSADHLAIVLAHGLRWNPMPPVRWAADAVMLIRGPALDWNRLVEISEFLRLSAVVGAGLTWLADNLEIEVPVDVLARLTRAASLAERIEVGIREAPPTGLLGALPQMLAVYAREALGQGRRPTPWGFTRSLGRAWGVSGTRHLAGTVARKARRRLAAVVVGGRGLAICLSMLGGCGWGSGGDTPAPAPTPTATPAPVSTTLPAGWDLAFPDGTVIEAVNWGESDPARDRVQLRLPAGSDGRRFFRQAFEARGLTVVERTTDGSSRYLEADGGTGAERFGVELTPSGLVLLTRHHPPR